MNGKRVASGPARQNKLVWLLMVLFFLAMCGCVWVLSSYAMLEKRGIEVDLSEPLSVATPADRGRVLTIFGPWIPVLAAAAVILASGWGRTWLMIYPTRTPQGPADGVACTACHSRGWPGRVYTVETRRAFLCDVCVRRRYRDLKILMLGMVLVGAFLMSGAVQFFGGAEIGRTSTSTTRLEGSRIVTTTFTTQSPMLRSPITWMLLGPAGLAMAAVGAFYLFRPLRDKDRDDVAATILRLLPRS